MRTKINRRLFIQKSAFAAGSFAILPGAAKLLAQDADAKQTAKPKDALRCAQIGCGVRSFTHLESVVGRNKQNLVFAVDPDESAHAKVAAWLKKNRPDAPMPRFLKDYREFFDKYAKEVDAVFIATPNHHHALPAMMSINAGIPVFCEKPLCHDISEARKLRQLSLANPKVATQMGNQGHCEEGYRRLLEYLHAGTIGPVTETHSWTDRANGGSGSRPPTLPVPAGMDWEKWIGPAPYRDYHAGLHPHGWHDWYDFGNGSIGNMGCHVLDGVYWGFDLDHPTSIEMEEVRGGSSEQYPLGARIRWDFPARGSQPPLKVYWHEGYAPGVKISELGGYQSVPHNSLNLPEALKKLKQRYPDEDFGSNGTIYIGEKGVLYTGTYGEHMHIVPLESMTDFPQPPKTVPRPKNIFTDFIETVQSGKSDTANSFDYGARLTEFTLLANLAMHAGPGKKLEWDGPAMKVTNQPDLNKWISRENREGWRV